MEPRPPGAVSLELQSTFGVTYLITFACYGSYMHGNPDVSVDRSTRRLFDGDAVQNAIRYVIEGQGESIYTFLS